MTGGHRRRNLPRLPSPREVGIGALALISGAIVAGLLMLAGAVLEVHERACARCQRHPQLYRRLVRTRADAVCWDAFATAHDDERSHRAADGVQRDRGR